MAFRDWVLLIVLSILWGGSFFFIALVVAEIPPLTVVLVRVSGAALVLGLVVLAMKHSLALGPRRLGQFLVMGLINNVIPFGLITWGQTSIGGSLASILNATTPLFMVVLAHFLTADEPMRRHKMAGVILGFAGVCVMLGAGLAPGTSTSIPAQVAILGAATSYALAGIYGKRFAGLPPMVTAAGQVCGSTIVLLPVVVLVDRPWLLPMPTPTTLWALAALALLSTALAYILYFTILRSAGAVNLSLVTFLVPVSALVLGTTLLAETLSPEQIVGMVLIALALLAVDGRLLRHVSRLWSR